MPTIAPPIVVTGATTALPHPVGTFIPILKPIKPPSKPAVPLAAPSIKDSEKTLNALGFV